MHHQETTHANALSSFFAYAVHLPPAKPRQLRSLLKFCSARALLAPLSNAFVRKKNTNYFICRRVAFVGFGDLSACPCWYHSIVPCTYGVLSWRLTSPSCECFVTNGETAKATRSRTAGLGRAHSLCVHLHGRGCACEHGVLG